MAYQTPTYNYEQARSRLTENKGYEDVARNYGRFMGQERFRRGTEDAGRQFTQKFPKVGSHFNRRGMWNSGLRREGQRNFAEDYQRDVARQQWDQGAWETGLDMQQTQSDAQYQRALLDLYENLQRGRAADYDPFAAIRGAF